MKISKATIIEVTVPLGLIAVGLVPSAATYLTNAPQQPPSTLASTPASTDFFNVKETFKQGLDQDLARREQELTSRSGHREPHHPTVAQVYEVFKTYTMNKEGCKQDAYQCEGTWTIGIGHTGPDVGPGVHWSEEKVFNEFQADAYRHIEAVLDQTPNRDLTPLQAAKLADFRFMLGSCIDSKVLKPFNNGGSYEWLADKILQYDRGTGSIFHRHEEQSADILNERRAIEEEKRAQEEIIRKKRDALRFMFTQTNILDVLEKPHAKPKEPFALPNDLVQNIKPTTSNL